MWRHDRTYERLHPPEYLFFVLLALLYLVFLKISGSEPQNPSVVFLFKVLGLIFFISLWELYRSMSEKTVTAATQFAFLFVLTAVLSVWNGCEICTNLVFAALVLFSIWEFLIFLGAITILTVNLILEIISTIIGGVLGVTLEVLRFLIACFPGIFKPLLGPPLLKIHAIIERRRAQRYR